MNPASVTMAYEKGVNDSACWDIDHYHSQLNPESWEWLRRIGHREAMAEWDEKPHKIKSLILKTINGRNLVGTIAQQVCSGR